MNSQKLNPPPTRIVEPRTIGLQIGDRVEIAGISHHQGEIVGIKNSSYSGLTYSVRVGRDWLEGVNPLALTKLC
jgi:hypothetical protein